MRVIMCQKAPSAKRCIKTIVEYDVLVALPSEVRKHRAPKGALRPNLNCFIRTHLGQKAPSAKRCIKTEPNPHPYEADQPRSESTERQKVH